MAHDVAHDPLHGGANEPAVIPDELEPLAGAPTPEQLAHAIVSEGLRRQAAHASMLELATRLLAAWTVSKPEAADEVTIELAAMTVRELDKAVAKHGTKESP